MSARPTPGSARAEVSLRPLVPSDWPAVRDVHAAGIATGHATFESAPPTWEGFDTSKAAEHRLVAVDAAGHVLGWAAVVPVSDRCTYAGVVEHSVYVAPAAQGRGVGRLLLGGLIASTEAAGVWTVQSGVFPENTASLALHASAGFRVVGVRERLGLMGHGPMAGLWRDVVLLERRSPVVPAAGAVTGPPS